MVRLQFLYLVSSLFKTNLSIYFFKANVLVIILFWPALALHYV